MDNELTQISCDIIAAVGHAKGLFIEAIQFAKQEKLEQAKACCRDGEEAFHKGHQIHQQLLAKFASGELIPTDILMVHAQCQMMSAEDFQIIATEVIDFLEHLK